MVKFEQSRKIKCQKCCSAAVRKNEVPIIHLKKIGKNLEVTARVPKHVMELELRIESERNRNISKITDISPLNPQPKKREEADRSFDREIWYPVVDVVLEHGMEGVAIFEGERKGECIVGGPFYRQKKPLDSLMVIPTNKLEYWENSLFVEPSSGNTLQSFYLRQRFPVITGQFRHVFRLLSKDWSGRVSLYAVEPDGYQKLATATVAETLMDTRGASLEAFKGKGLTPERLLESLKATVDFTIGCQNTNPHSSTYGGPFLFYDLDAQIYRTSHWMWGWGPSVSLLLETVKIPGLSSSFDPERLRKVADDIGRAGLRFQLHEENHPANGLVVSSWSRGIKFDDGYLCRLTSTGALFLAGWAWIPLFEVMGDTCYLDAAKTLSLATEGLMDMYDIIPQSYQPDKGKWSDTVLNESGFGVEGLAELYRVTGEERYRKIGLRFIEKHLLKLQRKDGLWENSWIRGEERARPCVYYTRAQGWAMEGLLAAYRLMPSGKYLDLAKRMADNLMKWQHKSGYWTHNFNRPTEEVGISEKGTALWSLLFYRLYKATGDERHLQTARKALRWCLDNQYTGPVPEAYGSLVVSSPSSAVGYREWFNVSCAYASAFFGLSVLEELKLPRD